MKSLRPGLTAVLLAVFILPGLGMANDQVPTVSAYSGTPTACTYKDTLAKHRAYSEWRITLLDTSYRLSSGYYPGDLVPTSRAGISGGGSVRSLVIADLREMAAAAKKARAPIAVQSAFRSYSKQASTFNYWVSVSGRAAALKSSARAGHSEHQLGTAIDFKSAGGGAPWNYTDWATTKAGAWMKANAYKYGFVLSYPKGQTSKVCYKYEPWHYRYVGRTQAAEMRASGLVPRYYLWKKQ